MGGGEWWAGMYSDQEMECPVRGPMVHPGEVSSFRILFDHWFGLARTLLAPPPGGIQGLLGLFELFLGIVQPITIFEYLFGQTCFHGNLLMMNSSCFERVQPILIQSADAKSVFSFRTEVYRGRPLAADFPQNLSETEDRSKGPTS